MSARREPSPPPEIPGHTYTGLLGMGGFADVFLYHQHLPSRAVAVKVLLAAHLTPEARRRFRTEADLMARLSHHPSIVTVHHADVAGDGRPFLVMEYCARGGLGQRFRTERMTVAEVLRIGIRLASAVETAHRAGILHRDIKPANVLITDFGWPALTDFGIATADGSTVGLSIPWSPPELLTDIPAGDERSDVYSLAATVYSLLARRSPFEVPGGPNTAADLVARIDRGVLPPIGRPDAPEELADVLGRALGARDGRPATALEFARQLNRVEAGLHLPPTPIDLPDRPPAVPAHDPLDEGSQATRVRPVQEVRPEATDPRGDAPPAGPRRPPRSGRRRWLPVLAGGVVVAALAGAAYGAFADREPPAEQTSTAPAVGTGEPTPTAPAVGTVVPTPTDLLAVVDGDRVTFTWTHPDPAEGDYYLWGVVPLTGDPQLEVTTEPEVLVPALTDGRPTCVEVAIARSDGRYSATPAVGCAP